jgi:hypothetical protein
MWMVATFGSTQPLSRWPRELLRNYADENGKAFDRKKYTVKLVGEKAVGKHPLMAQWGQPFNSFELGGSDVFGRCGDGVGDAEAQAGTRSRQFGGPRLVDRSSVND